MKRLALFLKTPARVVIAVGLMILVVELLIMLLISGVTEESSLNAWRFVDPILLTALVSPALYILIFRPMRNQQVELERQLVEWRRNEQLTALIEAIPDAVFLKDGEGRWLVINEPAKQMFQLHDLPWQGKTDMELADLYPAFRAAHQGCLAGDEKAWQAGKLLVGEEIMPGEDGRCAIIETRKVPLFSKEGQRRGLVIIGRDITERKQAEQALRISEERFKTMFVQAPLGIALIDSLARHIYEVNPRFAEIAGRSMEELSDIDWLQITHPDDVQADLKNMALLNAGKINQFQMEKRYLHPDATVVWINMTIAALKVGDKARPHHLCMIQDITERKQTEALLKEQQTQIKLAAQVFAQGREGITVTDASGTIIMVNQAFTEITGYTQAEVLGQNPRILHSGRQSPEFYRAMWEAITTVGHWSGEIWNRQKDGTIYPAWLAIASLRDGQNNTTNYVANFSDLSDAKAAENHIQWLSYFDVLTGLPNRALLQDRTAHSINMMQRASKPLTMMLVGIDYFKSITDTLGHHIGDELLMEVAKRLSNSVRAQDTVARLSGKEFVLVLPDTPAAGAAHLATELLLKMAQPYQLGGHELTLTASIGIASYPDNGSDSDTLLKATDIAMRRAQANGRNGFEFYTDAMYQQVWAHDHLTNALRMAIELDQLELVYQPQVDLQTGQISGLEALLRWQLPELGPVSPLQFIPLAEESGLIIAIGEWVLRRACRDIRRWLDRGFAVPHVAVNASPLQFRDNNLAAQVASALTESQIDPALLYIEVTESALMDDVPQSEAMLKALKDLGIKLSLDDFGTGYSSLSYLKRFPFDQVKIDQSFVRDITTSQTDVMLVKVIVSMAHGFGMKVIAEGVETEAQCEIMRTSICDEIQGYFFSKPISAQAIEELFSEGRQLPAHLLRLQKPQRTLLLVDNE